MLGSYEGLHLCLWSDRLCESHDFLFVQVTYNELEQIEPKVDALLKSGRQLMEKSQDISSPALSQNMKQLQHRWDNIKSRSLERKVCFIEFLVTHIKMSWNLGALQKLHVAFLAWNPILRWLLGWKYFDESCKN